METLAELKNLLPVMTLPFHHSDARGDRHFAIVTDGEYAGAIVDLVWGDDYSIEDVRKMNVKFAWVDRGMIRELDKPPRPSIARICEIRQNIMASVADIANDLRRIADELDPPF